MTTTSIPERPLTEDSTVGEIAVRAAKLGARPSHVLSAVTGGTAVVDARFAGGPITVEHGELHNMAMVNVTIPGVGPIPMFANEARELSSALRAFAEVTK